MAKSPLVSILPKSRRFPGGISRKGHDLTGPTPFYDRLAIPRSLSSAFGYDGLDANVITAPVLWIMRTFTEAVAVVERRKADGFWERALDHDAELLLDRPNDAYDTDALWKATVISYVLDGNAYWRKVRNRFGDVRQLWYVPHTHIRPKREANSPNFIDHYDYTPFASGTPVRLERRDVVHFRMGLDPRDPMVGFSPLKALLHEVGIDEEAQRFTADLLVNNAVPGLIMAPKDVSVKLTPDQTNQVRQEVTEGFTGARRGSTMVFGVPMESREHGFDPNKLMLGNLRDISEERVCAVLGIPAAVVGFGSGMQSTKVGATLREMVNQAQNDCIIPMQKTQAKQLTAQLLPDFVGQVRRFRFRFDRTDVSRFQEEMNLRAEYVGNLITRCAVTVAKGQEMLGLEVDPKMNVYLFPSNAVPAASPDDLPQRADPPPAADDDDDEGEGDNEGDLPDAVAARMNGNGNGREGNEASN